MQITHTYPVPRDVKPQDHGVLYQLWTKAKQNKDYKRADELRDWFEFWHGETFVREGEFPYHASKDNKPTVAHLTSNQWKKKYSQYMNDPDHAVLNAGFKWFSILPIDGRYHAINVWVGIRG